MKINDYRALLAFAIIFTVSGNNVADTLSKNELDVQKSNLHQTYQNALKLCDKLTGHPYDKCAIEAKGKYRVAKAELANTNNPSAQAQYAISVAKAKATYHLTKETCDEKTGDAHTVCIKEAKAVRVRTEADAKALMTAQTANKEADAKVNNAYQKVDDTIDKTEDKANKKIMDIEDKATSDINAASDKAASESAAARANAITTAREAKAKAVNEKNDADFALAKEKCNGLKDDDSKNHCISQAKVKFNQ